MGKGIFGTRASFVADMNLILQIVILGMLSWGVFQAKRRRFQVHHTLMTVAVIANAALIVAVMNPSFFRILPFALRNPGADKPTVLWPHMVLGAAAEVLGIYVILATDSGALEPSRRRILTWLMRITFLLWALALIVGIGLYFVWYT